MDQDPEDQAVGSLPTDSENGEDLGLIPAGPISEHEVVELDFLRYESAHLQARVRDLEDQLKDAVRERDTIQHERNLMAQDFRWTLNRLASSPAGPALKRMEGFRTLLDKWAPDAL
ncbi:MAG: hypothetical protein HKN94_05375 [Acidimicrobiales bacterium]|nr:hypothetical protein [Acidimicrobiales bacterium]RZV48617.1 MAG: hypothetical protein EX269_01205 [Acidimicrobiales bacterium]